MSEQWAAKAHAKVEETTRLASEIRAIVERTRLIIANSREILAVQVSPGLPERIPTDRRSSAPPDSLCATFDALLEAARQAEETGDPELFALVERALLHAGDRIEQAASTLVSREPTVQ